MERAWGESMTGVQAKPEMHFRNGAIAIAYMGTVLLKLQELGILSLDDKLSEWFPDYPKADQITLRMLMNGTSGYADYVNMDVLPLYDDPFRHWYADELVEIGLSQPMVCEPGECWSYAHTNFVILGLVMEQATGRRLDELIEEGILIPLALSGTRSEETAIIPEPVLHAFTAERGTYEEATFWSPSWTLAQGAIMTTDIGDVLTSAEAIGEGWLLSPESQAAMFEPLTAGLAPWSEDVYYGLGVFSINGWIVQNPSFHGYAATMAYLPAQKLALAVTVTLDPGASLDGNLSTDVLKEIAAHLAPDAPM
jgi:CubicO group peptidase (beta-lactamase class C family)